MKPILIIKPNVGRQSIAPGRKFSRSPPVLRFHTLTIADTKTLQRSPLHKLHHITSYETMKNHRTHTHIHTHARQYVSCNTNVRWNLSIYTVLFFFFPEQASQSAVVFLSGAASQITFPFTFLLNSSGDTKLYRVVFLQYSEGGNIPSVCYSVCNAWRQFKWKWKLTGPRSHETESILMGPISLAVTITFWPNKIMKTSKSQKKKIPPKFQPYFLGTFCFAFVLLVTKKGALSGNSVCFCWSLTLRCTNAASPSSQISS